MSTKEDSEKVAEVETFWGVLDEFIQASRIAVEETERAKERGEDVEEINGAYVYFVPDVPGGWLYNLAGPGAKYTYHVLGPAFLRKGLAAEFLDIIKEQGNGMLVGLLFREDGPDAILPRMKNWYEMMADTLKTSQEAK